METARHSTRVLIVDDDNRLCELLTRFFLQYDIAVSSLPSAHGLEKKLERDTPHVIVLDWMLPGTDGVTVLRSMRARGIQIPVVMLSANGEEQDRIAGLEAGADDYLAKPFSSQELLARIQAVLRRSRVTQLAGAPADHGEVSFGPFRLDLASRSLYNGDEAIALTTGEFAVLRVFVTHPREPLTRDRLMMMARGRGQEVFDRAIDVQISRLRKLVEPDPTKPRYIQTVWGFGYVFVP